MGTQKLKDGDHEEQSRLRQALHAIIGEQVMHLLGRPSDFFRIKVNTLWEHRYRVNVITGTPPTSAFITHSYFVTTDGEGNIIASNPRITKQE
jgi:hypothetical protein